VSTPPTTRPVMCWSSICCSLLPVLGGSPRQTREQDSNVTDVRPFSGHTAPARWKPRRMASRAADRSEGRHGRRRSDVWVRPRRNAIRHRPHYTTHRLGVRSPGHAGNHRLAIGMVDQAAALGRAPLGDGLVQRIANGGHRCRDAPAHDLAREDIDDAGWGETVAPAARRKRPERDHSHPGRHIGEVRY